MGNTIQEKKAKAKEILKEIEVLRASYRELGLGVPTVDIRTMGMIFGQCKSDRFQDEKFRAFWDSDKKEERRQAQNILLKDVKMVLLMQSNFKDILKDQNLIL